MQDFNDFYQNLMTLPRLISDLALSVAEAKRRMDVTYIQDLKAFMSIVSNLYTLPPKDAPTGTPATEPSKQAIELFKVMGPSRFQFTEVTIETRADIQMTTSSTTKLGGSAGLTAPFAVSVNASYEKRTATDARAAALVRVVMNSVTADEGLMSALLDAAKNAPGAPLPDDSRYKALADAFKSLETPKEGTDVAKAAEGAGASTEPAETNPEESKPAETKPAEAKPVKKPGAE
jgi:hypothetical protein